MIVDDASWPPELVAVIAGGARPNRGHLTGAATDGDAGNGRIRVMTQLQDRRGPPPQ